MADMTDISLRTITLAPALLLMACSQSDPAPALQAEEEVQNTFFSALAEHCGKAYSGQLVSDDEADADFIDAAMVMHVSECSDEGIAVPFHVELNGEWDRSRTWLITRTDNGLRLKHDHRHEDGESDQLTMYGGDTTDEGTTKEQSFPVDQFSIDMFNAQGYEVSVTNVWSVEVDPAGSESPKFTYQLKRTIEGGAPEPRLFRVEFDLSEEVEAPPPAWGHE
ncbi:MAG: hypothetical protein ABJ205_07750 [Erythrobacter sp.]|uniref:hypothetical protein n=1 Tax=Erythrobacter sp. TaxID=1042 RepID=UPI0032662B40